MVGVAPGLLDHIVANSGHCALVLGGVEDVDAARQAMTAARRAVGQIPHPEEPDDPLASFMSAVGDTDDGPTFWFDAADLEAYDGLAERVLAAVVDAIDSSGVHSGTLGPFVGDPAAVRYPERQRRRSHEPTFVLPDDFPMPDDVRELTLKGHPGRGGARFFSDVPVDELLAFFEERLPYEIVDRRTWRISTKAPAILRMTVLLFVRGGEPGYVSCGAIEYNPAIWESVLEEQERRGRTPVDIALGEHAEPDQLPADGFFRA